MPAVKIPRLEDLTLREKIAQLIFVRIGSNLPPIVSASDDETRIGELLSECPVGGLLMFNGSWPETAQSLARLQEVSRTPLLVAADLERGAGQQLRGLTVFPHARAFAQLDEGAVDAIQQAARVTSQEALAAGVHILFAPVADANTNPKNPIIATRAFGEDPDQVAKLVTASVEATQQAGALATAKHFPGHGDTSQDSHAELPSVDRSADELRRAELVPFRAAVEAGVALVMTAHVSYPALDPSGAPATFSPAIIEGVLREELGFGGVVCSDSLLMEGARGRFAGEGEMAEAALTAGVDLILDLADPKATVDYLADRVEQGELSVDRINRSVNRVLSLKHRIASADAVASPVTSPAELQQSAQLAAEVARRAIRLQADRQDASSPLVDASQSVTAILFKPFNLPSDPPEQPLATALREALPRLSYFEFGPEPNAELVAQCIASAAESDRTLLAIIAKPAAWHAFGMTPQQTELAQRLTQDPRVIVASLGVPTLLEDFPSTPIKLCTFSDVPASQKALAALLCGRLD